MDDALLVRGLERLGDLARDRERVVSGSGPAAPSPSRSASVSPSTSSSTSARIALVLLEPVDRGDVRVIERREQARLALEAREPVGIRASTCRAGP